MNNTDARFGISSILPLVLAVGLTLFYISSSGDTAIDKEYERINHTTPPDLSYKWH